MNARDIRDKAWAETGERFARDVARQEMTVLRDDGLYRHLRFRRPDSGAYWFELVTWPGAIAITGDVEGWLFRRTADMFDLFRGQRINPDYWAEKLEGGRDSAREYSEDVFSALVREHVSDAIRSGYAPKGLGRAVTTDILHGDILHEEGARRALDDFEFYTDEKDRYDLEKAPDFRFENVWEWDLADYSYQFLWCCHAIPWAIARYDHHAGCYYRRGLAGRWLWRRRVLRTAVRP